MYEAVTAHPEGTATVARHAATAARYGYEGVVVRAGETAVDHGSVAATYGVDVVDAVEVDTDDPAVLAGTVGAARSERTLVLVRGGDEAINRQAVEDPKVDVLATPMRADGDLNHVLAAAAARNGVRLEADLGPVLRAAGGTRVRALSRLRKLRELAADAGARLVVSARPRSQYEHRAPRELRAVGEVVGFDPETVTDGLREWGRLAERNRHRASDMVVEPGVEVTEGPATDEPDGSESRDGGDGR